MAFILADFVIDKGSGSHYLGTGVVQYPARSVDHAKDAWPYRCTWVILSSEFDEQIDARIQACLCSTAPTTIEAILAVHSDESVEHWSASPKWPEAIAIIEWVKWPSLRSLILSCPSQSEASIFSKIESLLCSINSFHRRGIAHGNIHSLTIRVKDGMIILPPLLLGRCCFDIHHDYCPPEHLLSEHTPTMPGDIWALACVMLEMLTGQSIFSGVDPGQILQRQQSQLSVELSERYVNLINWEKLEGDHRDLAKLLTLMLNHDASQRLTISAITEAFDSVFQQSGTCYIRVQPRIEENAQRADLVVLGRTGAWWRDELRAHLRPEAISSAIGQRGIDTATLYIEIGTWYNNKLDFRTQSFTICLQFGDMKFTSNPINYPSKSLKFSHSFSMSRNQMINICSSQPLFINLVSEEGSASGVPVLLGIAEVDLGPLLSGFPHIEGYYQMEPCDVGQIDVHVRPTPSLDQRRVDSVIKYPTWALFNSFLLSN